MLGIFKFFFFFFFFFLQVAVGRVHQPILSSGIHETGRIGCPAQPVDFISKHTNDGKFVFIDQR